MTHVHMHVGTTTDPRRHIVYEEVEVLVYTGLQAERSDDAGGVMFLGGLDEDLAQFEGLLQEGLAQRARVVAAHGVLWVHLGLQKGYLLGGRQPDMAVQRCFEPPVDAYELEAASLGLDG